MRRKLVAGNWKMNHSIASAVAFVEKVAPSLTHEQLICVPSTLLAPVSAAAKGTLLKVGAQNMHFEDSGAFTGEVSADMILEAGATYCILGHSERRQYFGETDETVNLKLKKAHAKGIFPIVCCGEDLKQRELGITMEWVKNQIEKAFAGIDAEEAKKTIVAYEPIWAIGTGKTASAADAEEVCAHIRAVLKSLYDAETAEAICIQYGGSVKAGNIAELMAMENIDGALVGGASLKSDDFLALCKAAEGGF